METTKLAVLQAAAENRRTEVFHHQINIDNYRLAIAEVEQRHSGNPDLVAFAEQLGKLLVESLCEQSKEQLLLTIMERQIEALEALSD